MTDLVEVSIRWRGEGDTVQVAGEFNSWAPQDLTKQEDGSWIVRLSLLPGKYMYKFVVEGDWVINQDMPTVSDDEGNKNNQIEVEDGEASGDSDSWEKVSIPEGDADAGLNSPTTMQKIAKVERIFSLSSTFDDTVNTLKENNGTLVEDKSFTDVYYDTEDYAMLRKGVWLRKRMGEVEAWQLRSIVRQELKISDDKDDVSKRLELEIGEEGSIEDIVKSNLQEMTRVEGKMSKWTVGETEIEIRKEGDVETVLVRVVGDIVTALKDLETSAEKLNLACFNVLSQAGKLTGTA
eukprot:GFUD01115774.1.p1 GENE.GFUD01115774.1~~GFUD01115774.1.p1  ORF type:complete len:293 (-),score=117.78 GFUD01115774.1:233-1111(-)